MNKSKSTIKVFLYLGKGFSSESSFVEDLKNSLENYVKILTSQRLCFHDYYDSNYIILFRFSWWILLLSFFRIIKAKLIYYSWEPVIVDSYHKQINLIKLSGIIHAVFSWDDEIVDDIKIFKFNFPYDFKNCESRKSDFSIDEFNSKSLVCQISGNKKSSHSCELYTLRSAINQASESEFNSELKYYGFGWDRNSNYKGVVVDKIETLKKYRFNFSFENMHNVRGYVTEKIIDCFVAGVVPIYYGSENIEEYIPTSAYIDYRNFASLNDLYVFLKTMGFNDWIQYIKSGKDFLQSESSEIFSIKAFSSQLVRVLLHNNYLHPNEMHLSMFGDILYLLLELKVKIFKENVYKIMELIKNEK